MRCTQLCLFCKSESRILALERPCYPTDGVGYRDDSRIWDICVSVFRTRTRSFYNHASSCFSSLWVNDNSQLPLRQASDKIDPYQLSMLVATVPLLCALPRSGMMNFHPPPSLPSFVCHPESPASSSHNPERFFWEEKEKYLPSPSPSPTPSRWPP